MKKINEITIEKTTIKRISKIKEVVKIPFNENWYVNGFTKISNAMIADPALTDKEFRVLAMIVAHMFNTGVCRIRHKALAVELGCNIRTTKRACKKLKELNYIVWKRTRGASTFYLTSAKQSEEVARVVQVLLKADRKKLLK